MKHERGVVRFVLTFKIVLWKIQTSKLYVWWINEEFPYIIRFQFLLHACRIYSIYSQVSRARLNISQHQFFHLSIPSLLLRRLVKLGIKYIFYSHLEAIKWRFFTEAINVKNVAHAKYDKQRYGNRSHTKWVWNSINLINIMGL